jgi:hypothetical protein
MQHFAEINELNLEAVERSINLGELNRAGLHPSKLEWFEARMEALKDRRRRLLATNRRIAGKETK